jgi:hypothetical protein
MAKTYVAVTSGKRSFREQACAELTCPERNLLAQVCERPT